MADILFHIPWQPKKEFRSKTLDLIARFVSFLDIPTSASLIETAFPRKDKRIKNIAEWYEKISKHEMLEINPCSPTAYATAIAFFASYALDPTLSNDRTMEFFPKAMKFLKTLFVCSAKFMELMMTRERDENISSSRLMIFATIALLEGVDSTNTKLFEKVVLDPTYLENAKERLLIATLSLGDATGVKICTREWLRNDPVTFVAFLGKAVSEKDANYSLDNIKGKIAEHISAGAKLVRAMSQHNLIGAGDWMKILGMLGLTDLPSKTLMKQISPCIACMVKPPPVFQFMSLLTTPDNLFSPIDLLYGILEDESKTLVLDTVDHIFVRVLFIMSRFWRFPELKRVTFRCDYIVKDFKDEVMAHSIYGYIERRRDGFSFSLVDSNGWNEYLDFMRNETMKIINAFLPLNMHLIADRENDDIMGVQKCTRVIGGGTKYVDGPGEENFCTTFSFLGSLFSTLLDPTPVKNIDAEMIKTFKTDPELFSYVIKIVSINLMGLRLEFDDINPDEVAEECCGVIPQWFMDMIQKGTSTI